MSLLTIPGLYPPIGALKYGASVPVRNVIKEKSAEEKARQQEWVRDTWKNMDKDDRKALGSEGKTREMMMDAIDTRCVLDSDEAANMLRVVARIPPPGGKAPSSGPGGGLKVYVLGRDEEDDDEVRFLETLLLYLHLTNNHRWNCASPEPFRKI